MNARMLASDDDDDDDDCFLLVATRIWESQNK
jgi:hypothetical protein